MLSISPEFKEIVSQFISDYDDKMTFLDEHEEIIIKCSLENMAKAFFKDYEIIWHDPNVNSQENQEYLKQLEKLCQVKTFTEWREAEDYIKKAKTVCHVITSGTNGELFVKEIFSSEKVPEIFTFCRNEELHSAWTKDYKKILCTETKIEGVISKIEENLLEWQKQTSSLKFDLPAFAPIFDESDKSQMNHLHHYLKVIPKFNNRERAKEDFIALSRGVYSHRKYGKFIEDFEHNYNDYNMEETLRWYTQPSFLFKLINNCLRIATSDSIQWSRFLLKDIERAIKDQYQTKSKNFSGLLYRAAYLSDKEWSSLKENMNREIEMHGFLSVSKDKTVAEKFMGVDANQKVFISIIVPKSPIEEEQGFAEVEDFSKFPKEKEVLFNVRSRFTVLETEEKDTQGFPYRHLVLLYGAQSMRRFLTEQNPALIFPTEKVETLFCSGCQVLIAEMTEKVFFVSLADLEGPVYCRNCLGNDATAPFLYVAVLEEGLAYEIPGCVLINSSQTQIPLYGYKCSKCGVKKQERYFVCTDCGEREKRWCQNCFGNTLSCMEAYHSIILESYPFSFWCEKMSEKELRHLKFQDYLVESNNHIFRQGTMYFETHESEKALEYFYLFLRQSQMKIKNHSLLTAENNNKRSQCNEAVNSNSRPLEIRKPMHEETHRAVASALGNIGTIYQKQGEYTKALEYHLRSLDIKKSAHREKNPDIASSYNRIGTIYHEQGKYGKALKYLLKSLTILQSVYGENHPDVAESYSTIGSVYQRQGKYNKALEYRFKSLNIKKAFYGENHPQIGMLFGDIGVTYHYQGDDNKALEHYSKSVDIIQSVHGENHPHIATVYDHIGVSYESQGKYAKALEYHLKALDIKRIIYQENHPDIANSLSNIGKIFSSQGKYNKALESHLKSLDISKSVHGENHPHVASSYANIGSIYKNKGEYTKALEYYLKSLDISKSVYEENHPHVARVYNNVGSTYEFQGNYIKALEYYLKSLDINKSVHGENHPDVAISYNNIGLIYYTLGGSNKALEYHLKSLNIRKSVYEENHPEIATSYDNIGAIYGSQREYAKALEYHLRSLNIRKIVHGENHPDVATSYNNIGLIYFAQGAFNKALEYNFKALVIFKPVYGENHHKIATLYDNIAAIYGSQREYTKALEYLLKALSIFKSIHEENHPNVATVFLGIGVISYHQGECNKALEYYFKALSIFKSIYEGNHATIVKCYWNIAEAYRKKGENEMALEYSLKAKGMDLSTLNQEKDDLFIEYLKKRKNNTQGQK